MNRYAVDGMTDDVIAGRRVLLLAPTIAHADRAFAQVAGKLQQAQAAIDVRRANGHQVILCANGGEFRAGSVRAASTWIGRTADVLVVDDVGVVDFDELQPVIAHSPHGELVRL